MKKRRILIIALSLMLFVGLAVCTSLSVFADSAVTESSWIAAPEKTMVKCAGGNCDHKECNYVYSFAVVGDTQNLNIYDVNNGTEHMKGLYNWILANKDSKNIQYVMGLGDITQAYYREYQSGIWEKEWVNAKEAISLLDGKIPYSLVRGNHDITAGFNGSFGVGNEYYADLAALADKMDSADEGGRPMAGFLSEDKIEDTYRKVIIGDHKYIIFTLDWHPTEECLDWVDTILAENSDYQAIITIHSFIYRDGTITDDYEDTFPYENLTGTRPNWEEVSESGGNVFPKVLWETVLSKHKNVEMILCGHIDEDDIITTQLEGENGNTVTAMLINPQSIDSTVDPVGMVAMFYVSADGKVMNVEYVSTVRDTANKNAYLGSQNQFEVCLDYTVSEADDGWTETAHGNILTATYNAYPFHVLMDDDSDESTDAFHFGSYADWQQTLKAIHNFAGNTRPSSHKKMKTYYIVMSRDVTDTYSDNHDNRAGGNFGKTVLDLNGNTLTLACSGTSTAFLPIYVNSAGKYPRFDIINGNISICENVNFIVGQAGTSAQGETGTMNLKDLNITYTPTAENAELRPLISWYTGSGTGSNYDITIENCNIDSSAISGAHTLFDFKDSKNNCLFDVTLKGGSINGGTAANTTLFATNGVFDKITFAKDSNENYTALTLKDSGEVEGVYFTETENQFVEFGSPVASGEAYSYSFVNSNYEITEYGMIDLDAYPKASFPFALFKNGELIYAFSDWKTFIDTDVKGNTEYQSGCTLLLRRDYGTNEASGNSSYMCYIDDLTIDLGGNTFTRENYHMFQAYGYDAIAHETSVRIVNGTLSGVRTKDIDGKAATPVIVFNNSAENSAADSFEFIFDGVTVDTSAGRGIVACYANGAGGTNGRIILNDCKIDRGSSSYTMTLFSLLESSGNKNNVEVIINGGTLVANTLSNVTIASYSDEVEAGEGSPDKVTLAEGSDGKYFTAVLPVSYTAPTTKYAFTDGSYVLCKESDDGADAYYSFNNLTTPYGEISSSYASVTSYPFAVFYNGSCKGGYSSYNKAIGSAVGAIDTDSEVAVCDTAYVVLRSDFVATDNGYFSGARGTLIVDLGGYTLSSSTSAVASINFNYNSVVDEATAEKYLGYTSNITFKNGTVRSNRSSLPLIAIDQANGSATTVEGAVAKKLYFGFEDVILKTSSHALLRNYAKTTSHGLDVTVYAKNCTFDFTGATEGVAMISLSNDLVKANIELVGCSVIASKLDSYSIYTIGDDDTAKLTRGDNGIYLSVIQSSNTAPTANYVSSDGANLGFTSIPNSEGKYAYALIDKDAEPDLTIKIPEAYEDASKYPVLVFNNGEYIGNGAGIYTAYTEVALAVLKESADNEVTILLRSDLTEAPTGSIGSYEMKGKLVIDLGGFTYTSTAKSFFGPVSKPYATYPNNPQIEVKNGTLNTLRLIQPYTQCSAFGVQYDFTLKNVTLGRSSKYWASLVATQAADSYTGYSVLNLTLEDCTIDLRTNEKTSGAYTLFELAADSTNQLTNVVIKGGEIIFGRDVTFANVKSGYGSNTYNPVKENDSDTIKFEKGKDGYTVFTYKTGNTVLTDTYDSADLTFVKISENDTDTRYRLVEKAAAEQNFVPKMSLTLDRDLILNIYIPMHDNLTSVKLGDEALDLNSLKIVDGYYVKRVALAAKEAAKAIKLTATLNVDGEDMQGTFTLSTVKYAEKIFDDNNISDTEKTLVRDVLQYIRSAYAYFGTSDEEQIAKINSLLGDYASKPTVEGSDVAETAGFASATFVLDGTPSMRFYLADGADASAYKFYIGERQVKVEISEDGTYVDIDVYAYALCETVTYTIDGIESGSFHINAYYAYVSGTGESSYAGEDKEALTALTECFWKYLQSARAYRESVVEN